MKPSIISAATCLGCGCTCDDIEVVLGRLAIVEARHACALGKQWFGTGAAPMRVRMEGIDASLEEALEQAAGILSKAARPRVLLGPDVSCETYREAVACADLLRARLDVVSSTAEVSTVLAIQEHGITTATLGEILNRADVVVFWGVDPSAHFPRYESRYAPGPSGVHVPNGRASRTVIAVDVDDARGPVDADLRVAITTSAEVDTLIALAALLSGAPGPTHEAGEHATGTSSDGWRTASILASHLRAGRYVAIVSDEESTGGGQGRIHRLLALGHALNRSLRGALSLLRGGGNRSGAAVVMTSQTGYPGAVDFASGVPRYRPHAEAAPAAYDAVLLVGVSDGNAAPQIEALGDAPTVVIGPRASEGPVARASVVIDSATAGIHSGGTAVRMDDVPIPLKQIVSGPPDATMICQALRGRLRRWMHS